MKPSKSIAKKKDQNNNQLTIQDYFQTAPKYCIQQTRCNVSDTKAFYIEALKDKLKHLSGKTENGSFTSETDLDQENGACTVISSTDGGNDVEISCEGCKHWKTKYDAMQNECKAKYEAMDKEWQTKYNDMKKSYLKLSLRHCEVDMKYDDLVKVVTNTGPSNNDAGAEEASSSDDFFTTNELKCLRSTSLEKKKDSTFILEAVRYLYKDNKSVLMNKTLQGVPERKVFNDDGTVKVIPAKDALTPEKIQRVQQLFIDRVTKSKSDAVEQGERIKPAYINKLFASAISNLSKPFKTRDNITNEALRID